MSCFNYVTSKKAEKTGIDYEMFRKQEKTHYIISIEKVSSIKKHKISIGINNDKNNINTNSHENISNINNIIKIWVIPMILIAIVFLFSLDVNSNSFFCIGKVENNFKKVKQVKMIAKLVSLVY